MATQILLKRGFFNIANATTAIATRGELGFNLSTTGSSLYSCPEIFGFDSNGDYLINPIIELNQDLLNTPLYDGGYPFSRYLQCLDANNKPEEAAVTNGGVTSWTHYFLTYGTATTVDPYDYYLQSGYLVLSPDKFIMRSGKYYSTAKVKWIPNNDKRSYNLGDSPFNKSGDNAVFAVPSIDHTVTHILNIGDDEVLGHLAINLFDLISGSFEEAIIYIIVQTGGDIDNGIIFGEPSGYTVVYHGNPTIATGQVLKLTITNLHNNYIAVDIENFA